jgi:hypothetical protein
MGLASGDRDCASGLHGDLAGGRRIGAAMTLQQHVALVRFTELCHKRDRVAYAVVGAVRALLRNPQVVSVDCLVEFVEEYDRLDRAVAEVGKDL